MLVCGINVLHFDCLQEFVDHIKDNHRDIVDEEVLISLERDLQKSRKKSGKTSPAKTAQSSSAATKKSAEKAKPKPTSKATPGKGKAAAGPGVKSPASRKSRVSTGDEATSPKKKAVCSICNAVLVKTAPSEMTRHINSRACRAVAAEKKLGHVPDTDMDPLDVDHSANNGVRLKVLNTVMIGLPIPNYFSVTGLFVQYPINMDPTSTNGVRLKQFCWIYSNCSHRDHPLMMSRKFGHF